MVLDSQIGWFRTVQSRSGWIIVNLFTSLEEIAGLNTMKSMNSSEVQKCIIIQASAISKQLFFRR